MALTPGAKLGPYEIQSPLGAGGMGEVYRARDTRLDRAVAIKILPAHLSSNPDLRARFEQEANATNTWRDHVIMWAKEASRAIDYARRAPNSIIRGLPTTVTVGARKWVASSPLWNLASKSASSFLGASIGPVN
jgi:hypothetical protein